MYINCRFYYSILPYQCIMPVIQYNKLEQLLGFNYSNILPLFQKSDFGIIDYSKGSFFRLIIPLITVCFIVIYKGLE